MRTSLNDLLGRLSEQSGARSNELNEIDGLSHGTLTLKALRPSAGDVAARDQDCVYIVAVGEGVLRLDGQAMDIGSGDAVFVRATHEHSFERLSDDFIAWVLVWGASGGEEPAPAPSVFAAIDA